MKMYLFSLEGDADDADAHEAPFPDDDAARLAAISSIGEFLKDEPQRLASGRLRLAVSSLDRSASFVIDVTLRNIRG